MVPSISVTHHALQRWRERIAIHADEGADMVIRAFREARRVAADEFVPFQRRPGCHYHQHPRGYYFVTEQKQPHYLRIITLFPLEAVMPRAPKPRRPGCTHKAIPPSSVRASRGQRGPKLTGEQKAQQEQRLQELLRQTDPESQLPPGTAD